MRKISSRVFWAGKSTKKISSNRPLRSISGGSWLMLLDVANTNTGSCFSCIQVRNVPITRAVTPESGIQNLVTLPFPFRSHQSTKCMVKSLQQPQEPCACWLQTLRQYPQTHDPSQIEAEIATGLQRPLRLSSFHILEHPEKRSTRRFKAKRLGM